MIAVLDASAVIAFLLDEPGAGLIEEIIGRSAVSTVNLSETISVLERHGTALEDAEALVESLPSMAHAFTTGDAVVAAGMRPATARAGLSLGDRACLALGLRLDLPVLTADRAWGKLPEDAGLPAIRLIR